MPTSLVQYQVQTLLETRNLDKEKVKAHEKRLAVDGPENYNALHDNEVWQRFTFLSLYCNLSYISGTITWKDQENYQSNSCEYLFLVQKLLFGARNAIASTTWLVI